LKLEANPKRGGVCNKFVSFFQISFDFRRGHQEFVFGYLDRFF